MANTSPLGLRLSGDAIWRFKIEVGFYHDDLAILALHQSDELNGVAGCRRMRGVVQRSL